MTRYELVERIGFGGMAEVFRGLALAAGGFEKPVAIKRILPHLSEDRRFVELLMAEAKILSQLRHRNIVQIYDVGLSDSRYFLVMEYVDGVNLGRLYDTLETRGKRLPMDLALHIGAEVCEALEHAHRARGPDDQPLRLVHRDVSPSNVLLSRSGEVKLTDFGIAKRMEDHTGHGGVRGKFAYISPEQASSKPVDARSDVFSLGIVLYELVLGHRLFSQLQDFEALRAVLDGRLPRPREVDASLPAELEAILLKALAHDPSARYATAGELGSELRHFRYTALSASGDPSAELASILERYETGEPGAAVKEHTVVRLRPPSELPADQATGQRAFSEARAIVDAFEEETRAVHLDPAADGAGERQHERAPSPLDEGQEDGDTTIMEVGNGEGAARASTDARGIEDGAAGRPDGGGEGGRVDTRAPTSAVNPDEAARAGAGRAERQGHAEVAGGERPAGEARRGRRAERDDSAGEGAKPREAASRVGELSASWLWLALAAVAVGTSAFFIASAFFQVDTGAPGAGEEAPPAAEDDSSAEAEDGPAREERAPAAEGGEGEGAEEAGAAERE